MLRVICDRCRADCDRIAYEIRVSSIHNPTPLHALDTGYLKVTDDPSQYRFVVCQECYQQMGFPNIYKVCETGCIPFRNTTEDADENHEKLGEQS